MIGRLNNCAKGHLTPKVSEKQSAVNRKAMRNKGEGANKAKVISGFTHYGNTFVCDTTEWVPLDNLKVLEIL